MPFMGGGDAFDAAMSGEALFWPEGEAPHAAPERGLDALATGRDLEGGGRRLVRARLGQRLEAGELAARLPVRALGREGRLPQARESVDARPVLRQEGPVVGEPERGRLDPHIAAAEGEIAAPVHKLVRRDGEEADLALNVLRTTRPKISIKRKRKRSGWSDAFARSVIGQMR